LWVVYWQWYWQWKNDRPRSEQEARRRGILEEAVRLLVNARYNQSIEYKETPHRLENLLSDLYQSFIAWTSLYDAADYQSEQEQRKQQVDRGLDEFRNRYLPQSVWLDRRARRTVERFIEKSESLSAEFAEGIRQHGYVPVRTDMADRVSSELGPLKKEVESNLGVGIEGARPPWRRIFGG
jgi:hypothetical protein